MTDHMVQVWYQMWFVFLVSHRQFIARREVQTYFFSNNSKSWKLDVSFVPWCLPVLPHLRAKGEKHNLFFFFLLRLTRRFSLGIKNEFHG